MTLLLDNPPGWKIGDLIPDAGYARCYGCHFPAWVRPDSHGVSVSEQGNLAAAALCTHCWAASTLDERLAAYRWLLDQWRKWDADFDELWPVCEASIRSEATGEKTR